MATMSVPSYDDKQAGAVLVTWLCCLRTVFATDPAGGCLRCRPAYVLARVKAEVARGLELLAPHARRLGDRHRGQLEALRHLDTVIDNAEALWTPIRPLDSPPEPP